MTGTGSRQITFPARQANDDPAPIADRRRLILIAHAFVDNAAMSLQDLLGTAAPKIEPQIRGDQFPAPSRAEGLLRFRWRAAPQKRAGRPFKVAVDPSHRLDRGQPCRRVKRRQHRF